MNLKVVHLSTSDIDGGAAIAGLRIHQAQLKSGIKSKFLVQSKLTNNSSVISLVQTPFDKTKRYIRVFLDKLTFKTLSLSKRERFTFPNFGMNLSNNDLVKEADVINLHWINEGFLSLKSISLLAALKKPLVFTLHDMWAFTGGCHYNHGCEKFLDNCGNCPSLRFRKEYDYSREIYSTKSTAYKDLNFRVVTPSNWLNSEAKKSSLFHNKKIQTIPNPINTEIFKPDEKLNSREKLNLPIDKSLILFGAMELTNERKGLRYLISALKIISEYKREYLVNTNIVIIGLTGGMDLSEIPFQVHILGKITNENKLVDCYNAADIYVAPSLQDNLPNTVIESLSCGTPVVAFNTGGMPDMIEHLKNGYLAELKSSEDLAAGIVALLSDSELLLKMKEKCRETALNKFNEETIANQYSAFYNELLTE
ncbi:MAG: glycosyltransferase family 4 protein [Ignavibacteriaceae bacterium]